MASGPYLNPVFAADHPGHAVGEDGRRYLFMAEGKRILLSGDGLAIAGKPEKVYGGWPIPDDRVIEATSLEGPKMLQHNGWFYMFAAEGGAAGPLIMASPSTLCFTVPWAASRTNDGWMRHGGHIASAIRRLQTAASRVWLIAGRQRWKNASYITRHRPEPA